MKGLTLFLIPAALLAAEARYARLGEFQGTVEVQLTAADAWMAAERNLPLPQSAWLRTGASSRVEIEFDDGSAWRLGPDSQGQIADCTKLSTGQRITLLVLDRGLAYFSGQAEGNDALTLAVAGAQVTIAHAARLRLEAEETWSQISVLEGTVRFSSPNAEIDLREGQTTRVEPANPARFFLSKEMMPLELDRWSEVRDKALAPGGTAGHVTYRYGLADMDAAGEWIQTEDLGAVWKPKGQEGWLPFQKGRWRWYDALGYTWVGDEPWGWLPYHHGRWIRRENLGWIWAPSASPVFKPGDVYWLRGAELAGWGPLAPGEEWRPVGAETDAPQEFLNVNTTFAAFQPGAHVIDPAGFAARPKEPLVAAAFTAALPSPPFLASRLEARRPLLLTRTRVAPVVESAAFQPLAAADTRPVVVINPPAPPPVVVITPPQPEPEPAPPVAYPVPVYFGIVTAASPPAASKQPSAAQRPPARQNPPRNGRRETSSAHPREPSRPVRREKAFRDSDEREIAGVVLARLNRGDFARAVEALDTWTRRYPRTDFEDDRAYYSIVAYNGLRQPARVVERARPLLTGEIEVAFQDPRQMILALYLVSANIPKLAHPTREQLSLGEAAGRNLLAAVPAYFVPQNRPSDTSGPDWLKAQRDLEAAGRAAIHMAERR